MALVVPLDRANVDTDAIIPKQFMKSVKRPGFGVNLFDELRYLDHGEPGQNLSSRQPHPDFPFNQPGFAGAQILLTRGNFGCGPYPRIRTVAPHAGALALHLKQHASEHHMQSQEFS